LSILADQSFGPCKFSDRAVKRKDTGSSPSNGTISMVKRTRVLGARGMARSGRKTRPSNMAGIFSIFLVPNALSIYPTLIGANPLPDFRLLAEDEDL
jgi:hypothetical protein